MTDTPSSSTSTMATLAKLTSLSTQTLSLLLERQRLQTLSTNGTGLHLPQITRNLQQLRTGISDLEEKEGNIEAVRLLKSQYERMRGMLGVEGETAGVQPLRCVLPCIHPVSLVTDLLRSVPKPPSAINDTSTTASSSSRSMTKSPSPQPPQSSALSAHDAGSDGPYAPYTDDPEAGYQTPDAMLQTQRDMMDEQDVHLDHLSQSINRQRDLSLQINGELDIHTGLLEEMDEELDQTGSRLSRARQKLDKVAKGAKNNSQYRPFCLLLVAYVVRRFHGHDRPHHPCSAHSDYHLQDLTTFSDIYSCI